MKIELKTHQDMKVACSHWFKVGLHVLTVCSIEFQSTALSIWTILVLYPHLLLWTEAVCCREQASLTLGTLVVLMHPYRVTHGYWLWSWLYPDSLRTWSPGSGVQRGLRGMTGQGQHVPKVWHTAIRRREASAPGWWHHPKWIAGE